MSIVVTAASSQLGRHAVEALLARGVPASGIVATSRDISRIKDLADRGVVVRRADFAEPDGLPAAFEGVEKLLLISTTDVDERVANHRRAIDAAAAAGVSLVAYTSMLHADTATSVLGVTHYATEQDLRDRAPSVMLRNGWYLENYTGQLAQVLRGGTLAGATGQGRISAATRADYAEAAAVVLLEDGHIGEVYELSGDTSWTFDDFAAAATEITGRPVAYQSLSTQEQTAALEAAGLDAGTIGFVTALEAGIRDGALADADGTMGRLIGRPTTPLVAGLRPLV